MIDEEISLVSECSRISSGWPVLVAATRELSSAETIASRWGAPVDRVISAEIAERPILSASLVHLIADPARWYGHRVSVEGFFSSTFELYLSREHAEVNHGSSILVIGPSSEQEYDAWSKCTGGWVLVEGFTDRDVGGWLVLKRIERLLAIPHGPQCWPPENAPK
jgi:hypothetical protein